MKCNRMDRSHGTESRCDDGMESIAPECQTGGREWCRNRKCRNREQIVQRRELENGWRNDQRLDVGKSRIVTRNFGAEAGRITARQRIGEEHVGRQDANCGSVDERKSEIGQGGIKV